MPSQAQRMVARHARLVQEAKDAQKAVDDHIRAMQCPVTASIRVRENDGKIHMNAYELPVLTQLQAREVATWILAVTWGHEDPKPMEIAGQ